MEGMPVPTQAAILEQEEEPGTALGTGNNGEGDADVILQVHTLNPRQLEMLALLDEIKKHRGEAKAGVGTATKKALVFPDIGEEIFFLH